MRLALFVFSIASSLPALAQTQPAESSRIEFPSVAVALKELQARDGNGTVVVHADGWTIINEPLASAQWSFAPDGHHAYPSVVRRIIRRSSAGSVSVETASLCEAPQAECSKLLSEFAAMDERITQSIKARGRQGSTQPAQ